MGTKYSTNAASGYNATPPSDDGTVSDANKGKWSTIKTKLADPVKTLADTINSELVTHFDNGPQAYTSNQTLGASHYNQLIQVSGAAVTLTLSDANTLGAGWYCHLINTDGSNSVTIGRATAGDTINGTAANFTLVAGHAAFVFVNAAANGFLLRTSVTNAVTTDTTQNITAAKTFTAAPTVRVDDATTNAVSTVGTLSHTTSGTPANNIGVGLDMEVETSASNNEIGAQIQAVAIDTTATSEDFELRINTMAAGAAAANRLRIGQGIYTPNATGGDQGLDTVNASGLYDDGVAVVTAATATNSILRDVDPQVVTNTTVETTVFSGTVTANRLSTNRMLRITAMMRFTDTAGTATTTIRVRYGGTTAGTMVFTHSSAGSNKPAIMESYISALNATNAQRAVSTLHGVGNAAPADGADGGINVQRISKHDTMAIDSTANQTLAISFEHSSAAPTISAAMDWVQVEII